MNYIQKYIKVGYAHCKGLYGPTIVHNLMYYSNKCQLFCTREQSAGGKRDGMVCELILKPINNDGLEMKLKST